MLLGFVLLFLYGFIVWLVFFKFRWLKFTIAWGFFSTFFVLHLGIIFLIGLRFVAPTSTDARVIQRTIQLTPRLSEPTLVTAVLVEPNVHVKRGTPLFQFDRRIYEAKVKQLQAQLAQAKQNVLIMKADIQVTSREDRQAARASSSTPNTRKSYRAISPRAAPDRKRTRKKWSAQVAADSAAIKEAQAEEQRSRLKYQSEIGGVNTTVAATQAELDQAQFYLDNTLMVAPEDGYIMNLQVRPGMVAGDIRFGAIASFICDDNRYLLANFFQENLKYVKPGQPVEVALDLYPGQIWPGKVAGDLAGQRRGPDAAERDVAEVPLSRRAKCRKDSSPSRSRWTIRTRSSSRSARRAAPRSTRIRAARSSSCARSRSAVTPGTTGSIPSPDDSAPLLSSSRRCVAGCALKTPPSHTDVVERALPTATRDSAGVARRSARRRGGQRLAEVVQRPDARSDRRRGDRQQPRPARGGRARSPSPSRRSSSSVRRLLPWVGVQRAAMSPTTRTTAASAAPPRSSACRVGARLWGRLRAQRPRPERNAEAAALDYAYARQSLAATTAKLWYVADRDAAAARAERAGGQDLRRSP